MDLILNRYYGKSQTIGTAYCGDFKFWTLELPDLGNQKRISCIPEGTYKLVKHVSPKFGDCFWLQDVPGRSEILIHAGNFAGSLNPKTGKPDLLGCLAPGMSLAYIDSDLTIDLSQSKVAMTKLLELNPTIIKIL